MENQNREWKKQNREWKKQNREWKKKREGKFSESQVFFLNPRWKFNWQAGKCNVHLGGCIVYCVFTTGQVTTLGLWTKTGFVTSWELASINLKCWYPFIFWEYFAFNHHTLCDFNEKCNENLSSVGHFYPFPQNLFSLVMSMAYMRQRIMIAVEAWSVVLK